jgi:mannose-6-phosphate isomerase-like protein (cupin superfamily)
MSAIMLADVAEFSVIEGVHGAAGRSWWRCLASPGSAHGAWEAFEWARVPPGGVSGEHRHTRTEELYFIVRGHARMLLDGVVRAVRPRDLVLTGVGSAHELRAPAHEGVEWLVVEVSSPATRAALARAPIPEEPAMSAPTIVHLAEVRTADASQILAGPLRDVALRRLDAGGHCELDADEVEHMVFVLEGEGAAVSGDARCALLPGTALTVPLGGRVLVEAGIAGLELFHAAVAVPALAQARA